MSASEVRLVSTLIVFRTPLPRGPAIRQPFGASASDLAPDRLSTMSARTRRWDPRAAMASRVHESSYSPSETQSLQLRVPWRFRPSSASDRCEQKSRRAALLGGGPHGGSRTNDDKGMGTV